MKITEDHRRHALCVVCGLPSNPEDARADLKCVRELVAYVYSDSAEPAKTTVVTLVRDCPDPSA
jgi:hypothetical protein